jgi:USP8 interacting
MIFLKSSFCCFLFLIASCTPKAYVFDGRKLQEVTVSDMGDLFSTYKLTDADKKELSEQLKNKAMLDQILTYSKEENWPDAVNTLNKRLSARTTMTKYRFFKVGAIGNKTIVSVPAEKNRHMPYGFVPAGVMYMVFKSSSLKDK